MELRQLRYFLAICEEGQITAAAKKLHMAQPPLSQQLKALEEELGVTLVKRGNRNIILTDAGEILKERSKQLLQECEGIRREVSDARRNTQHTLRIGIVTSSHGVFLEGGLQNFRREYPYASFDLREGNTYQVMDMLEKGMVEIGIVRTPFPHSRYRSQILRKEEMVAVVRQDQNPFSSSTVTIRELKDAPLIYYERYENLLQEIFIENGFLWEPLCRNQDARTTMLWAKEGLGIGIVPRSATIQTDIHDLAILPIQEERLMTEIIMITMKERYLSDTAAAFFDFYKA